MGLQAAFRSVYPIYDFNETAMVDYLGYSLESQIHALECLQRGHLCRAAQDQDPPRFLREGRAGRTKRVKDIKEQECMSATPLMTRTERSS